MVRRPKVLLTRRFTFSASHRLHSSELSADENRALFGKCNRESGHGHNYEVRISLLGELDARTGMVFSLAKLKQIIADTVETELDHRHLNIDVPIFRNLIPTAENLAVVIWGMLESHLPPGLLHEVEVSETENNTATYRGES